MKQKSIYFGIAAALTAILLLLPVLGGCKKEQRDPQDLGYFLSLSESSITLSQGASQMLTATFSPASALVLWESGDDKLLEVKDGVVTARIEWSSPNYDYMVAAGKKLLPVNEDGNSVFEIPVRAFDRPEAVKADTTAMSKPYEIAYTLTFDSETIQKQ